MGPGSTEQKRYRCGATKPMEDFAWRRKAKNQRDSYCRACRAAYKQEHYKANRQRYIDRSAVRKRALRLERTTYLMEYFAANPCSDCGEQDPVVLEFDHRDDKLFDIGAALITYRWTVVLEEIAKCDVVCANCHRRRTARRRDTVRVRLSKAGDRTRTGTESLEGSCANRYTTPARASIIEPA